jgi:hypothetical protein
MPEPQRTESSLTKQSDLFRVIVLVVLGSVGFCAWAYAVGLIIPSWGIFKISLKTTADVTSGAPSKPSAASAPRASDVSTETGVGTAPQSVDLTARADTASQGSEVPTTSAVARLPAVKLQDSEPNSDNEGGPDSKVPAPSATIVVLPQEPQVNSGSDTGSRDVEAPATTSSIVTTPTTSPPQDVQPPPSPPQSVQVQSPITTPPSAAHPIRSAQTSPPGSLAPKQHPHSEPMIGQRMWYK